MQLRQSQSLLVILVLTWVQRLQCNMALERVEGKATCILPTPYAHVQRPVTI